LAGFDRETPINPVAVIGVDGREAVADELQKNRVFVDDDG
jgi:hypothetical protein